MKNVKYYLRSVMFFILSVVNAELSHDKGQEMAHMINRSYHIHQALLKKREALHSQHEEIIKNLFGHDRENTFSEEVAYLIIFFETIVREYAALHHKIDQEKRYELIKRVEFFLKEACRVCQRHLKYITNVDGKKYTQSIKNLYDMVDYCFALKKKLSL